MTIRTKTLARYHSEKDTDNHEYEWGKCPTCSAPIITSIDGVLKTYCGSCEYAEQNITPAPAPWDEIPDARPSYDELLNGAKFTHNHRAELRTWWDEHYKPENVKSRMEGIIK